MGNGSSTSSSLYDCGDRVPFQGTYWSLYNGNKKETSSSSCRDLDDKDKYVSIFTLTKSPAAATNNSNNKRVSVEEVLFPIGSRAIQKLKSIKHPNFLTYVDCLITAPTPASTAATTEQNYLMLITEPVIPLSEWLAGRLGEVLGTTTANASSIEEGNSSLRLTELQLLYNEVLWGFKALLHAARFLHEQMKASHNYIMLPDGADGGVRFASVYVNRYTNEWKLGNLEFCCTENSTEDEAFCARMGRHMVALSVGGSGGGSGGGGEEFSIGNMGKDVQQLGTLMTAIYGLIDQALSDQLPAATKRDACSALSIGRGGVPTAIITTLKKMTTSGGGSSKGGGITVDQVLRNCAMLRPVVPTVTGGNEGANASTNVVYLMEYMSELQQKIAPTIEVMSFVQLLVDLSNVEPIVDSAGKAQVGLYGLLSGATLNARVLPLIGVLFQYCIVEYNNRNTRELYRQAMQVSLLLLCALTSPRHCSTPGTKINVKQFHRTILPYYAQLFSINDRLIRTSLLKSVKDIQIGVKSSNSTRSNSTDDKLVYFLTEEFINTQQKVQLTISSVTTAQTTPGNATISLTPVAPSHMSAGSDAASAAAAAAAPVCKAIIDSVVLGFNDSSAKMREDTLKGLVPLLPHLNATNLNDKLALKYLVNLQQCETEASIRTNCIILIGKIAHMLNDATRQRLLVNCIIKAIRDPFVHCRVAGLRTAQACMDLLLNLVPVLPGGGGSAGDKSGTGTVIAQAYLTAANNVLTKLLPTISGVLLDSNVNIATVTPLAPAVLESYVTRGGVSNSNSIGSGGNRANPFRDERELALACIGAITTRISTFHANILTPYENHQQQMVSASNAAAASGVGGATQQTPMSLRPATATVNPSLAGAAPAGAMSSQSPGPGQQNVSSNSNYDSNISQAPPSPARVATAGGSSWLGSFTSTLNRTLESATGAGAGVAAAVAGGGSNSNNGIDHAPPRSAEINIQRSTGATGLNTTTGSTTTGAGAGAGFGSLSISEPSNPKAMSLSTTTSGSNSSKTVTPSTTNNNAWGDDDFGGSDDDDNVGGGGVASSMPRMLTAAATTTTTTSISKANAWNDDDFDDDEEEEQSHSSSSSSGTTTRAPAVTAKNTNVPISRIASVSSSSSLSTSSALTPKGPLSAHNLGSSLSLSGGGGGGSAASASASSAGDDNAADGDIRSVSMDDFLNGSIETGGLNATTGSQVKTVAATKSKGLTIGGLTAVSRPPAAATGGDGAVTSRPTGMGLSVPARAPVTSAAGPSATRPSTGSSVKRVGVIKKIAKDTAATKSKEDDWADF